MSSVQPRIAVLIPSYNAEHSIAKALASLAANVEPHDIVIVDDASLKPLRDCLVLPATLLALMLMTSLLLIGFLCKSPTWINIRTLC